MSDGTAMTGTYPASAEPGTEGEPLGEADHRVDYGHERKEKERSDISARVRSLNS